MVQIGRELRSSLNEFLGTIEKLMEGVQQNSGWLTATEAAEYLKLQTRSLLLWVRQGKLQAYALSAQSAACGAFTRKIWILLCSRNLC